MAVNEAREVDASGQAAAVLWVGDEAADVLDVDGGVHREPGPVGPFPFAAPSRGSVATSANSPAITSRKAMPGVVSRICVASGSSGTPSGVMVSK